MKKLTLISVFLLTFLFQKVISQEFAPIGATWHYTYSRPSGKSVPDGPGVSNPALDTAQYYKCICLKDSFYFGKMARMVNCKGYGYDSFSPGAGTNYFFHQNNDTIFYFRIQQGNYVVYQYLNKEINDTLIFDNSFYIGDGSLTIKYKVNSIDYETINNENVKKVSLKWVPNSQTIDTSFGPGLSHLIYYEGIGNRYSFFPWDPVTELFHNMQPIRCYESPTTNLINFGTMECEYRITSSINDMVESPLFTLFPNPAENEINLQLNSTVGKNAQIEIKNTLGQIVWQQSSYLSNQNLIVPINQLSSGIYFISLVNNKNHYTQKFFKP